MTGAEIPFIFIYLYMVVYYILLVKFLTLAILFFKVGFKSSRYYWSMKRLYKRCRYVCSIVDNEGQPGFKIRIVEPGQEDMVLQDVSPKAVWNKILEPLDRLRRNADLVKIFPSFTSGEELFGLTEQAIVRVLESVIAVYCVFSYNIS